MLANGPIGFKIIHLDGVIGCRGMTNNTASSLYSCQNNYLKALQ